MTDAEKQNLVELLDSLVMAAVPKAAKVAKFGGTLYTLRPAEKEGQCCGVFPMALPFDWHSACTPVLTEKKQALAHSIQYFGWSKAFEQRTVPMQLSIVPGVSSLTIHASVF